MADTKLSDLPVGDLTPDDDFYINDGGTSRRVSAATALSHTGEVTGGVDGQLTITDSAVTESKIATAAITTNKINSEAVTTAKLAPSAVDQSVLASNSVTTSALVDLSVTNSKLGDLAISDGKIQNNVISGQKLLDGAVTNAKLDTSPAATLKGRAESSSGVAADVDVDTLTQSASPGAGTMLLAKEGNELVRVQVTTLPQGGGVNNTGSNLNGSASNIFSGKDGTNIDFEFRGIIDSSTINATENTNDITLALIAGSVDLAHMADLPTDGFIGNDTGGSATPSILSGADAAALIGIDNLVQHNTMADVRLLGNTSGGVAAPAEQDSTAVAGFLGLGALAYQDTVSGSVVQPLKIRCVDEATALFPSTSVPVASITLPFDCTLNERTVNAYIHTAPQGSQAVVDVHLNGTSLFTTKITVGANENDSDDNPAPVFGGVTTGTRGDLLEVFTDTVGTGTSGSGLDITFYCVDTTV